MYVTLTTLWNLSISHLSEVTEGGTKGSGFPRAGCETFRYTLVGTQKVHKTVKASYTVIITSLEHISM